MAEKIRRILGFTFDGKPLWEPSSTLSSITWAATGGGKTTCTAMPSILAMLADTERAVFINDIKAEIAPQIAEVCLRHGRRFGLVDRFGVLGADNPHRIEVNPFSSIALAAERGDQDLPFLLESMTHTFVPEVEKDTRNFYFREEPSQMINLATRLLLHRKPNLATPGGVHALLADPEIWEGALEAAKEEIEGATRAMAQHTLWMREHNKEHYSQHLRAALTALKIFAEGPLHEAGFDPDLTHEDLIRDHWVVGFVNPTRHVDRLGPFFAQHFTSLFDAQLSGPIGKSDYVIDEFCASPMREIIKKITVFRAFGARGHFIAQSRMDSVKRYGEHETAVLEENCAIKTYLKFSSYAEAERVSRAMGETRTVTLGIGTQGGRLDHSLNISTGRERVFSAEELMRLPPEEQIIHIAGLGFIHCLKVRQNQLAPYCFELGENPLEGGRLEPDPKITLPTPSSRKS